MGKRLSRERDDESTTTFIPSDERWIREAIAKALAGEVKQQEDRLTKAIIQILEQREPLLVKLAAEAAVVALKADPPCGLSPEMLGQASHSLHMLADLGGGVGADGTSKGVEIVRENHKFVSYLRARSKRFGERVATSVIVGLVILSMGGIGSLLWYAITTSKAGTGQ